MEDVLRAITYFVVLLWAVVFLVYPPEAYVSTLDVATRIFWMSVCAAGALVAVFGSILRLDLKVELPGLIFMGIGPLFYFAAQVYYSLHPLPDTSPTSRYALTFYALLPLLMTVPRMYALYAESRRVKLIRQTAAASLTPEQEAQPGAFKINPTQGR